MAALFRTGDLHEQAGVSTVIIGASKPEQLDANLAAFDVSFDEELSAACESVWWTLPRKPVREGYR